MRAPTRVRKTMSTSLIHRVAVGALLAGTLLLHSGFTSQAWAQKMRVVVELFKGPNAERVRFAVVRAVLRENIEVVQAKKVAMVEADLGLIRASDNYSAVARELKAQAFIGGTVLPGRRPRARIVVRSADGTVVGQAPFQGMNVVRLVANIGNGGPRFRTLVANAGGDSGGGPVAKKGADPLFGDSPSPAAESGPAERAPKEEPVVEREKPEAPPAKGDADVEAEAPPSTRRAAKATSKGGTGLNVAFVMRMFSRNFVYNQSVKGGQQGYRAPEERYNNLPLVPAPGLALEYFAIPMVGVTASYNRAIVGSKDTTESVYKTTSYDWSVGAKGRIPVLGTVQVEPVLAYRSQVFTIEDFGGGMGNGIQVAPVAYGQVRAGGGVRLPLESGAAISAGAAYLHILSAGDILDEAKYFGGNALGGEVYAAMTMPLGFAKGFDLRLGADYRRFAFAFTPILNPANGRIAGGATDSYIGLNVGIGYNLGL